MIDTYLLDLVKAEEERQAENVELIASENFCSDYVRSMMSSCLTNKYCEGYPNLERSGNRGRYYGGCEHVDLIEQYCISQWQKVFHTDYHVNVQPHSGSQANLAAYQAVLKPGDKIMSMSLDEGGHLTHGSTVNASGKLYQIYHYHVGSNGYINYDEMRRLAFEVKPKLILAGASAYPREIDFKRFAEVASEVGALLMVDMAHIAGLVATGFHQSPFGYADLITTTTHKTLRGPRGGMIFCKPELAKKVDSAVFPGTQGGPLMHVIAAKAACAEEALTPAYHDYIRDVVVNAKSMSCEFVRLGYDLVTGGTENHLMLIDFSRTHPELTGLDVQELLDKHHITLNKNCVPNEQRSPKLTSGVRIGTPAMTTRGWNAADFVACARTIDTIIHDAYEQLHRT